MHHPPNVHAPTTVLNDLMDYWSCTRNLTPPTLAVPTPTIGEMTSTTSQFGLNQCYVIPKKYAMWCPLLHVLICSLYSWWIDFWLIGIDIVVLRLHVPLQMCSLLFVFIVKIFSLETQCYVKQNTFVSDASYKPVGVLCAISCKHLTEMSEIFVFRIWHLKNIPPCRGIGSQLPIFVTKQKKVGVTPQTQNKQGFGPRW